MDPDSYSLWFYLLLLVILIAINAFFAMSEIAVISLNDSKIRRMAADGDRKARTLLRMVDEPSRFLSAIQVGVTLSGLLASAVAADTFTEYVVYAMRDVPVSPALVHSVSLVVITLILAFFTLVFGELVPKRIAMQEPEKISFAIARMLRTLCLLERPFVALLSASTNGVLRMIGIDPHQKPEEVTEEEIRMMIDVGSEGGSIEESEKDMIHNVFEFGDRVVDEIMTHRTEITAIELGTPLSGIIATAVEEGFSRIPVYEDDMDNIIGILYVKDLLRLVADEQGVDDFDIRRHMRAAFYVPESNRCKELFEEFQRSKIQMAIVVDEYGGTSGLVTMEDLIESIVGNIQDEYDNEEEEIHKIAEDIFSIDGVTSLDEVERLFGVTFDEEDEYDTIGGYIIGLLGRIPNEGEHPCVTIGGIEFTVLGMEEHRIDTIRAVRKPSEPAENRAE